MKYDALKYFIEIVEQGSINKASETLYISQPNLSTAIRNLEADLRLSLLNRTNRGIQLTENGKEVYFFAKRIFNQLDHLERFAEIQSFEMPVSFSMSINGVFLCDEVFNQYFEKYRDCKMQFNLYEVGIEEVLENVACLKSDLGAAVVNDLQMSAFKRLAEIKNLEVLELGQSKLYALVGEKSPLFEENEVIASQLLDFPLIRLPDDYFTSLNFKEQIGSCHLDDFSRRIVINHCHSIVHLLKNSTAFFGSSKWAAEDLSGAAIRPLEIKENHVIQYLMLVRRKRETLLPSVEDFEQIFIDHYQPM